MIKWKAFTSIKNIAILALIALLVMSLFHKPQIDTYDQQYTIDSLSGVVNTQLHEIELYKDSVKVLNTAQAGLVYKADSLNSLLSSSDPCELQLHNVKKQTKYLRQALVVCNKAKAIHVKTIKTLDTVVIHNDIICDSKIEIVTKECKVNKRALFFKGMGTGAIIVTVVVIIIIL